MTVAAAEERDEGRARAIAAAFFNSCTDVRYYCCGSRVSRLSSSTRRSFHRLIQSFRKNDPAFRFRDGHKRHSSNTATTVRDFGFQLGT
jgi:hypothetical protein